MSRYSKRTYEATADAIGIALRDIDRNEPANIRHFYQKGAARVALALSQEFASDNPLFDLELWTNRIEDVRNGR